MSAIFRRHDSNQVTCPYCGQNTHILTKNLRHPQWKDIHAVNIYRCDGCGSYTTYPMPTPELLHKIYLDLETGYPAHKSMAKKETLQHVWYSDILTNFSLDRFQDEQIADIGSGEGWLALAILDRMRGSSFLDCYDIHRAAPAIREHPLFGRKVAWMEKDAQDLLKGDGVDKGYDRVFLVSIIEHVPKSYGIGKRMSEHVECRWPLTCYRPSPDMGCQGNGQALAVYHPGGTFDRSGRKRLGTNVGAVGGVNASTRNPGNVFT